VQRKIACTHPGKIGDALYCLPTIKALSKKYNCKIDFYTSSYCKPLKNLFLYQSYINDFIIPKNYIIKRFDMGIQPWKMPVNGGYDLVYHLGFKRIPDKALPNFIAETAEVNIEPIQFEYPDLKILDEPYYVIAPRKAYKDLFNNIVLHSDLPFVVIGGKGDNNLSPYSAIDKTGTDFLETVSIIANSKGFVGLMSSQLVLANGFDIPKVAPHDGKNWDMRHVVRSKNNFYPVNPTYEEVIELLKGIETFSKTLSTLDYEKFDEFIHISNIHDLLNKSKIPMRFEHPHRKWEYGMALKALRNNNTKTVLDIGGGGSVFAPACSWIDMEVTQVDPGNVGTWIEKQSKAINKPLNFIQKDFFEYNENKQFDAVTCLSVIEHVPHDREFFSKLLSYVKVGGLLVLTTDFHPTGKAQVSGHLRTYNEQSMQDFINQAKGLNFSMYEGEADYSDFKVEVNSYTFCSLVMKRVI